MTNRSGDPKRHGALRGTLRGAAISWWMMGAEATFVLPLRLWRLSRLGEEAAEEARLMVTEKVEAHMLLARRVSSGSLGTTPGEVSHGVARHYLGYVRANRRRLVGAFRPPARQR